jgi:hypothetical protein
MSLEGDVRAVRSSAMHATLWLGLILALPVALAGPLVSASPHLLQAPVSQRPVDVVGPGALSASPPPTIQDGIGPGSALQQHAKAGSQAGFLCTAAFLLRDPVTATYYLSTAGHCLVVDETDTHAYTGAANPDKVDHEILICIAGCIDNALGLGTYVSLVDDGAYHPVTFAQSGGIGQDFGIVEIPPSEAKHLRPELPQWGGPHGTDSANAGDLLVHYGHGTYCCPVVGGVASRTPADQGRTAVALSSGGDSFEALGWVTGGDSGSGIALAAPDPTGVLHGTAALGVITHGLEGEGSLFDGTMLPHALDMVRESTGLSLQLVEEGDPLTAVPDPNATAQGAAHIGIAHPIAGSTVQASGGTVTIDGTAAMANGTRIEVSVDDATYGFANRLPVTGNGTWQATWYVGRAAAGNHTLHARLVGPQGTLAETTRTIRLARSGAGATTATPGPGHASASGSATAQDGGGATSIHVPSSPATVALATVALAAAFARRRSRR